MTDHTVGTVIALFAVALAGLLFGCLLAALGGIAYLLHRAAMEQKQATREAIENTIKALHQSTRTQEEMRRDVASSLAKIDAERMQQTSFDLAASSKRIAGDIATLGKLLYAQQGTASQQHLGGLAGFPSAESSGLLSMDNEAELDEPMIWDRQRWQEGASHRAQQAAPPTWSATPPSPLNYDPAADPLANMTTEQRAKAVADFFTRRRMGDKTNPAADSVVASMAQDLAANPPATEPLPDLGDGYLADEHSFHDNGTRPVEISDVPSRGDLDD